MKTLIITLLIIFGSLGAVLPDAHAYTQPASVIDSGGGVSTSAGYENLSAIGQPVVGFSSGAGGSNYAGFIPALGAHGALWPVIGFDPASFTFTFYLGEPAPAGQGLTIANAGGSTLAWTVSRTQAWLVLSPLAGTVPDPVTVGINIAAPGLAPGVYHDTITISADGAENSGVTIPVTLTVGTDYTLTVQFGSPTTPPGGGTVAFSPAPAVGSATCTGEPCQPKFHAGTPVTITPYGDGNSLFSSWSGECGGSGACAVTMDADRTVTATFSYVKPARLEGSSPLLEYDTLQAAYSAAPPGGVILAREFTFVENLTLGLVKGVTIKGGYAPNFVDRPGYSFLQGIMTIGKGSVITDRLSVK